MGKGLGKIAVLLEAECNMEIYLPNDPKQHLKFVKADICSTASQSNPVFQG